MDLRSRHFVGKINYSRIILDGLDLNMITRASTRVELKVISLWHHHHDMMKFAL